MTTANRRQKTRPSTPPPPNPEPAAATTATPNAKPGRPQGAKTQERPPVAVRVAKCPRCGSTNRSAYTRKPLDAARSGTVDGEPFNRIAYRDCKCADCGQPRREIHYYNDPPT